MTNPEMPGGRDGGRIRAGIRRAFSLAGHDRLAEQVDDEVALHIEFRAQQLEREGMTAAEARAEAVRRFGASAAGAHSLRRTAARRERWLRIREGLDGVWYDVRQGARSLLRHGGSRGMTAVIVLTLALGIGANASMFGVIDRLLLSGPAQVRDPGELRRIYVTYSEPGEPERAISSFGYVAFTALQEHVTAFTGVAAYAGQPYVTLGRGMDAEQATARFVTSSLFPLLGTTPALGRFFTPDEERPPRGERVVVIDHGTWQRRFGGDPQVLGRTVTLDDEDYTIIGVARPGFTGVELRPVEFWLPVSASVPMDDWTTTQGATWLRMVGRLAPGATAELAAAQATAAYRATQTERPPGPSMQLALRPLWFDQHGVEAAEVRVSRWLVGVSAALLLVACANVANLLLARGLRRRREIAVRLALGVSRGRLVRLLLVEAGLLALAGGVAGLAAAYWGMKLLSVTLLDGVASWTGSPVDGRVMAYTALATLVTALLVGLLPALRASDPRLAASLASGNARSGAHRSPFRGGLTVAQGALSALLLIGAGLFIHSLWSVQRLDMGVHPDPVLRVSLSWSSVSGASPEGQAAERVRRGTVMEEALERLRSVPGVGDAARGMGTPFYSAYWAYPEVPGYDSIPAMPGGGPYTTIVSDGYFETMGTTVTEGRGFTVADMLDGAERVAVVNETMARTLWPSGDAIGQCFAVNRGQAEGGCSRVVGIAHDTPRFELNDDPAFQIYQPRTQASAGGDLLLVRADGRPAELATTLRDVVFQVDPTLLDVRVELLSDVLAPQLRPWRLGAVLFALFGAVALVVAAVGLYSVMSHMAAGRAREMGVRLALGARPGSVRWLVMRQGLWLGGWGVMVGLGLALAGGRWAEPMLFGTSPREPGVLAVVVGTLLAVAVLASAIPAWRASRVSPAAALRE